MAPCGARLVNVDDDESLSYDYSKIKSTDWRDVNNINPLFSGGEEFEYNLENHIYKSYIEGGDEGENPWLALLRWPIATYSPGIPPRVMENKSAENVEEPTASAPVVAPEHDNVLARRTAAVKQATAD